MRYTLLLTALILTSISVMGQIKTEAQQEKEHKRVVKHTVVTQRDSVYYAPDTIAVIFQELVIKPDTIYVKWNRGFIIWQTFNHHYNGLTTGYLTSTGSWTTVSRPDYYITKYEGSEPLKETFLYSDRKTKVTNKVVYSIKQ